VTVSGLMVADRQLISRLVLNPSASAFERIFLEEK
jgi:hypothetical protein